MTLNAEQASEVQRLLECEGGPNGARLLSAKDLLDLARYLSELNEAPVHVLNEYVALSEARLGELAETKPYRRDYHIVCLMMSLKVMEACHGASRSRMEVRLASPPARGGSSRFQVPRPLLSGCPLGHRKIATHPQFGYVKEVFKEGHAHWRAIETELELEPRLVGVSSLCRMYDILIEFEGQTKRPDALTRIAKMQKRKLTLTTRLLSNLEAAQSRGEAGKEMAIVKALLTMDLLDTKMKQFERTVGSLDPRLIQKMVHLSLQGIRILDQLRRDLQADQDILGLACLADRVYMAKSWYLTGKFYNKLFTPRPEENLGYSKEAVKYFDLVVLHATRDPQLQDGMVEEFTKSRDTSDLLKRQIAVQEIQLEDLESGVGANLATVASK